MAVYQLAQHSPRIHPEAWVAASASVIGRVALGAGSSVWYGAVIRGDNEDITIGERCSIQDGCVLHADEGVPLTMGDDITVGHQAMLHGCSVGSRTLIGIQAVVLNHARIGSHCIVAAGALVGQGKVFPDGVLLIGAPAKVARELTPEEIAHMTWMSKHYVAQAARHRAELVAIG